MRLFGVVLGIAMLSIVAGAAVARPDNWRDAYKDSLFAPQAIADFDQARTLLREEMDRLVQTCDLTPAGAARLEQKLGDLEYQYIVKWYGPPEVQAERNAARLFTPQSNSSYDQQYREPVRSTPQSGGPARGASGKQ